MSFHLYTINELYSNADGSIQFIEMAVGNANNEGFWAGLSLGSSQGGTVHTYTFPANLPSEATANTKVLIATQGFANLGIVSPDFIIPAGFLFSNGGTLNYAGVDTVSYGQLPTDGVTSLDRNGNPQTVSETNFAGATSSLALNNGGPGNDTLTIGPGNLSIDGGGGIDTAVFSRAKSAYTISPQSGGSYQVSGADGSDTLSNVERLQFSDARVALDIAGNSLAGLNTAGLAAAGQVYRLYQASFNRAPDQVGLAYWIGQADSSVTLTAIAAGFTGSVEFSNTYGNLTDHQFVDQLYQNVLHRPGESDGVAYWYAQIDSRAQTREQVLVGFSESNENQAALIGLIQNGIGYTT